MLVDDRRGNCEWDIAAISRRRRSRTLQGWRPVTGRRTKPGCPGSLSDYRSETGWTRPYSRTWLGGCMACWSCWRTGWAVSRRSCFSIYRGGRVRPGVGGNRRCARLGQDRHHRSRARGHTGPDRQDDGRPRASRAQILHAGPLTGYDPGTALAHRHRVAGSLRPAVARLHRPRPALLVAAAAGHLAGQWFIWFSSAVSSSSAAISASKASPAMASFSSAAGRTT